MHIAACQAAFSFKHHFLTCVNLKHGQIPLNMTVLHAENTIPNGTTAICSFNNSIVVLSIILNIKLC